MIRVLLVTVSDTDKFDMSIDTFKFNGLNIILASQSPKRKSLLLSEGCNVEILVSNEFEEDPKSPDLDEVTRVVKLNAQKKGESILKKIQSDRSFQHLLTYDFIIAADSLGLLPGEVIFGKPKDTEEAHMMIERMGGKDVAFVVGVFVLFLNDKGKDPNVKQIKDYENALSSSTPSHLLFDDTVFVKFKKTTREERESCFLRSDPLTKAGAFSIDDSPELVLEMRGGTRASVCGMPVERLKEELGMYYANSSSG